MLLGFTLCYISSFLFQSPFEHHLMNHLLICHFVLWFLPADSHLFRLTPIVSSPGIQESRSGHFGPCPMKFHSMHGQALGDSTVP